MTGFSQLWTISLPQEVFKVQSFVLITAILGPVADVVA